MMILLFVSYFFNSTFAFDMSGNEEKLLAQVPTTSEWQISSLIKDLNDHTEKSVKVCLQKGKSKDDKLDCLADLQKFRKKIYTKINDRHESALSDKDKEFLEYSFIEKQIEKLTSL